LTPGIRGVYSARCKATLNTDLAYSTTQHSAVSPGTDIFKFKSRNYFSGN